MQLVIDFAYTSAVETASPCCENPALRTSAASHAHDNLAPDEKGWWLYCAQCGTNILYIVLTPREA